MLVPPILLFFLDIPFFLWWVAPFMETPKCWNRSATTNGPNKWPNGQRLELPVKDGLWNIHQFGATGINRSATSPVGFWPMFFICQYPIIPLYTSHIYSRYIIFISHLEVRFPFRHRGTPSSHPSQQRPLFRSKEPVVGDPRWLPIASGDSISSTIPIETTRFIILLHHNWPVTCPIYCFFCHVLSWWIKHLHHQRQSLYWPWKISWGRRRDENQVLCWWEMPKFRKFICNWGNMGDFPDLSWNWLQGISILCGYEFCPLFFRGTAMSPMMNVGFDGFSHPTSSSRNTSMIVPHLHLYRI